MEILIPKGVILSLKITTYIIIYLFTGMTFTHYSEYFDRHLTEIFSVFGGFTAIHILNDITFNMNNIPHMDSYLPYLQILAPYLGVIIKSALGGVVGYYVGKFLKKRNRHVKKENEGQD
jgi:hypothetical protein